MSDATAQTTGVPQWDVADRMRKALREAGAGVQDIADYMKVSRNTVSSWINGRSRPDVRTLRVWALYCGVPYEWLAKGKEDRDPRPGPGRGPSEGVNDRRRHTRWPNPSGKGPVPLIVVPGLMEAA